eukprot:gene3707-7371_t
MIPLTTLTIAACIRPSLLIAAILGMSSLLITREVGLDCMGAPYLYVTVHDMIHNVLKYSRDGCLLESNVLSGGPLSHAELRGARIGTYMQENGALYVTDASTDNSQVLVYGACNSQGVRPYRNTVVTTGSNPGADHAYGIAFDSSGNIYVSFQHTDVVLGFYKDSFRPMPLPSSISYKQGSFYQGTFFQYGKPGEHEAAEQGIRDIAFVGKYMWIANEDINSVAVVDSTARIIFNLEIDHPVGVYYDRTYDMVFIGSKSDYGAVYGVNPNTFKIEKEFYVDGMKHPAGISSYGSVLYVAEQSLYNIMTFNINTQKFIAVIVSKTPGKLEQLEMSQC